MTAQGLRLVAVVALAVVATSCGAPTSSPSASVVDPSLAPTESAGVIETIAPVTPGPLLDGQTETAFGRIWDTLPSGFPLYPGVTRSDEAQDGPSSGVYVVEGEPDVIATWLQDALEIAAFSTESLSGPFEDGGFEIDSVGQDPACRVRVTVAPLGGLTAMTVFYGTGCPHG